MANPKDTLEVLQWAKQTSSENEAVRMFWEKLCDAISEEPDISADAALRELRFYGSNTLLRPFRDNPISYSEVAYDVADTLKPMFREGDRFREGSLSSCEDYVLEKMKVSRDDVEKICGAIGRSSENQAIKDVAKKAGAAVAVEGAGVAVAKVVAQEVAKQVAADASKKVASKAAQKAAEQAAKEVAKQVAQRVIASVNIFLAAWTVVSIAGPAMRVTIPAVTYIALIRKMYMQYLKGV